MSEPTDGERGIRFELLERLGQGASGTVWRARMRGRHGLAREVALKIAEGADEHALTRLRDEARLLGLLYHRGTVAVSDLVRFEGSRWGIVMELLDGVDLVGLSAVGAVPPTVALEVLAEVADVLHAAYEARDAEGDRLCLLHRDIKPANIMLCTNGTIKVLDFGVATARLHGRESRTLHGELWGTPGYMAPERREGVDLPAGDVYALGLVFCEITTHHRFGRASLDAQEHGRRCERVEENLLNDGLPSALARLIAGMLAFDPTTRPGAREVREQAIALRPELSGPDTRAWARRVVPLARATRLARLASVELSGTTLRSLDEAELPRPQEPEPPPATPTPAPPRAWVPIWLAVGVTLGLMISWIAEDPSPSAPDPADTAQQVVARAPSEPPPVLLAASAHTVALRTVAPQARESVRARPPATVGDPADEAPDAREIGPAAQLPPASAPPAEPAPATPAPALEEQGTLIVRGDLDGLIAVSSAGSYPVPGAMPAGGYRLERVGPDGAPQELGRVWIPTGALVTLSCTTATMRCAPR